MDEERRARVIERQQRVAETIIQAADDSAVRQQLLEDPRSLFGRQQAAAPPPPEHVQALRREIVSQLVDRAAADAEFRALLRQDLFQAVRSAGLTPRLEQLRAELPVAEVSAYWGNPWDWPGWGWPGWNNPS
jgi:hypothetical protein